MLDLLQKSKPVAFLGFGDLGQQLLNLWQKDSAQITVFDDLAFSGGMEAYPFNNYLERLLDFKWIVALGYKHRERKAAIIELMMQRGAEQASIVHASCFVSGTADLADGVVAYPMCNIDKGVTIRSGTILNNSVIVSHDSQIDIASYLSPGVILSGHVKIGKSCFLGSGAIVSNGITIGDNVVIGAGTVVTKDVPSGSSVVGNPMRLLSKDLILK